jgi:hypothetical protein
MYCCFWYVLLFLVSILFLIFAALIGVLGSFLGLCVPRVGHICIRTPISISVCYIISLAVCVFWLISICSLVLQLWMCAYVVPQSTFRVFKGYNYYNIFSGYQPRQMVIIHSRRESSRSYVIILVLYLIQKNGEFIFCDDPLFYSGWFYTLPRSTFLVLFLVFGCGPGTLHSTPTVVRCSSRSSVSEEHFMGPSMSVCLSVAFFFSTVGPEVPVLNPIVAQQWDLRSH